MVVNLIPKYSTNDTSSNQKNISKKTIKIALLAVYLLILAWLSGCSNINDDNLSDINSISVTPATASIKISESQTFVAKGTKANGLIVFVTSSATWSSSNSSATVSSAGVVHGLSSGTSVISATLNSISGSATVTVVLAQSIDPVSLGTAGAFVILAKTGVTNSVAATLSITGDIGSSPITAAAMNTIPCANVNGTIYGVDAAYSGGNCFFDSESNKTLVDTAVLDMELAYADALGRTSPDFIELAAGDISGMTLVPGLYKWETGVLISGAGITLSGGATDVWIFQIGDNLTIGNSANITMSEGVNPKNVFWQVSGQATIGTDVNFKGIILSHSLISVDTGTIVNGRLFAQTKVTLQGNIVSQPQE